MVLRPARYQPPLRRCLKPCFYTRAQTPFQRASFHASARHAQDGGMPNHYETLDLESSASTSDIKKQFYKLSKTHHPDRNPNDPQASERFVKVSEAYHVLGSTDKRARYDRDFLRFAPQHYPQHHRQQQHPSGSYSSASTPAGGRPASGLSRRRTQFKGPPPSFYRSGGWGTQGQKRSENAARAAHDFERASGAQYQQQQQQQQQAPGTGPAGFTQGFDNDVPHFDREGHFRTQDAVENKYRAKGRRGADTEKYLDTGPSALFNFVLMSGVLTLIFGVSGALLGKGSADGTKKKQPAS